MVLKKVKILTLVIVFLLGLAYLTLPGPDTIEDFSALPNSLKSDEPGDTYQNPNIAAYFSDARRSYVTNFYRQDFQELNCCKNGVTPFNMVFWFLSPIRLSHPPEEAFQYIRDQQTSTYLEQFLYPLRSSIFVNGYEPFDESGKPFNQYSRSILIGDKIFETKTTIRFYPSSIIVRILIYLGIWGCSIWLWILFNKARRGI